MATVIPFEERAVAHLRRRLGAIEEANQDLIAFARGHSGAVASIHEAVLAGLEAESIESLFHVITQEWPLLGHIHQISYSIPYASTSAARGIGDLLLNYRIQLTSDTRGIPAFSPRISVILPTGDSGRGRTARLVSNVPSAQLHTPLRATAARAARSGPVSLTPVGAKSSGRPTARICHGSPFSSASACNSAPSNVVKPAARQPRVSTAEAR